MGMGLEIKNIPFFGGARNARASSHTYLKLKTFFLMKKYLNHIS